MIKRPSHLDDADLWLLEHDPLRSKTTPKTLANLRIRQKHSQGPALLNDAVVASEAAALFLEDDRTAERLIRLAPPAIRKLVALRLEFPSASQAQLARMMGCSRQAVNKKRRRLLAYLEAMVAFPLTHTSGSVSAARYFMEPNGQLAWDFIECK